MKTRVTMAVLAAMLLAGAGVARADAVLAAAEAAFEKKDFATALPLLQQLAEDQKDNRGVWLEIKKRINVCKANLKPDEFDKLSWKPGMPRLAPKREVHLPPKQGETRSLGIKQLGNFDYDADKGGQIPPDVKALSGSQVTLWGFMVPMREAAAVTEFALIPSPESCCFGQPPAVHHTVMVRLTKGTSAALTTDPVRVTGTLKVDEQREDDFTSNIFTITAATLEKLPRDGRELRGAIRLDPPTTAP